jgi:hypothetical protein
MMPTVAGADDRWHCTAASCKFSYSKKFDLHEHTDAHNGKFVMCPKDGCQMKSSASSTMVKHVHRCHKKTYPNGGAKYEQWRAEMKKRRKEEVGDEDEESEDEAEDSENTENYEGEEVEVVEEVQVPISEGTDIAAAFERLQIAYTAYSRAAGCNSARPHLRNAALQLAAAIPLSEAEEGDAVARANARNDLSNGEDTHNFDGI